MLVDTLTLKITTKQNLVNQAATTITEKTCVQWPKVVAVVNGKSTTHVIKLKRDPIIVAVRIMLVVSSRLIVYKKLGFLLFRKILKICHQVKFFSWRDDHIFSSLFKEDDLCLRFFIEMLKLLLLLLLLLLMLMKSCFVSIFVPRKQFFIQLLRAKKIGPNSIKHLKLIKLKKNWPNTIIRK